MFFSFRRFFWTSYMYIGAVDVFACRLVIHTSVYICYPCNSSTNVCMYLRMYLCIVYSALPPLLHHHQSFTGFRLFTCSSAHSNVPSFSIKFEQKCRYRNFKHALLVFFSIIIIRFYLIFIRFFLWWL